MVGLRRVKPKIKLETVAARK
jgi:hypothetical protein